MSVLMFDFGNERQARGYQRPVDRRRSKTFKSITVPDEVLQEAGAFPIAEDEDEEDEDDEGEFEIDEYGESCPHNAFNNLCNIR